MALQRQQLVVNVGSLRQDLDPHVLGPNAGLLELTNCQFLKGGSVSKRYGSTGLTTTLGAGLGALPTVWQLATHKGALVWLSDVGSHPLATYAPDVNRWNYPTNEVLRGPISVSRLPYAGRGNGSFNGDSAVNGQFIAIGCATASSSAYLPSNWVQQIVDSATGKVIYSYTSSLSASAFMGHVVAVGNYFVHMWLNLAGQVVFSVWNATTLATVGTPTQVVASSGYSWGAITDCDLLVTGGDEVTAIWTSGSTNVMQCKLTVSTATPGTAAQLKDHGGTNITGIACQFVTPIVACSPTVIVASGATGVKGHVYGSGIASNATTSTVIDSGGLGTSATLVAGYSTSATNYNVLYEVPGSPVVLTTLRVATVVGGSPTLAPFQTAGLGSKPFLMADGFVYAVFRYPSTSQPSFFLLRLTNDPVNNNIAPPLARFATWSAFFGPNAPGLGTTIPQMSALGSAFVGAFAENVRVESAAGQVRYDHGTFLAKFSVNDVLAAPVEAADCLYVPGGMPAAYDGQDCRESAWNVYPELTGVSYSHVGSGLAAGQIYEWIGIFRWLNAQGRVIRSALSAVLRSTAADDTATVTYTQPRLSGAAGGIFELYRIPANGTTFYKVASATLSINTATSTINDNVTDAAVVGGEELYSQPDADPGSIELEFEPAPPTRAQWVFDQRLWCIDAEHPTHLRFTTQFIDNEGPRWNEALDVGLDDQYGDCVMGAAMDDKNVIFKSGAIYIINGVGPDINDNGSYNPPQLIASGYGIDPVNVRSVLTTVHGTWFMARRGICLLTRGLEVKFIGSPIGGPGNLTDGYQVTAAVHVPELNQVRWYAANKPAIFYDYEQNAWSTAAKDDTGLLETDTAVICSIATLNGGLPMVIREGLGSLYWEDKTSVSEFGVGMSMAITFPWLSLAGLRGYQRLYKIEGIGSTTSGARGIGVTIAYDFDPTNVSPTQLVIPAVPSWQWDARPQYQLSTAFRVRIVEQSGTPDIGFTLVGLALEYGVKGGLRRIDVAKRAV